MKGILWTFVTVILIAILLTVLFPSYIGAVGSSVRISALINAEQMAGIVNVLESSPHNAQYKFFLPNGDCTVSIKAVSGIAVLNFSATLFEKEEHIVEIIERSVNISGTPAEGIKCAQGFEKPIYFARVGNVIRVSENEVIR